MVFFWEKITVIFYPKIHCNRKSSRLLFPRTHLFFTCAQYPITILLSGLEMEEFNLQEFTEY